MSDRYTFHEDSHAFFPSLFERRQANEDTPLSLSPKQRERLWGILVHEAGPTIAARILKRVEEEA